MKACVFCGRTPSNKTEEHVIPQWLIKYTGDPNRRVNLGHHDDGERAFAFDQFQVPACQDCNTRYSALETNAKPIVEAILNEKPIAASQANILLTWLDKVRIGLWLAFYFLDKNRFGINPTFHIDERIAAADRMVAIYRAHNARQGVNFYGVDGPPFQWQPSCFGLRINHLYFLNISKPFLLAARIGFPFLQAAHRTTTGISLKIASGYRRMKFPLVREHLCDGALELYQPILCSGALMPESGPAINRQLYDNPFVRSNCAFWEDGLGAIFMQDKGRVIRYPDGGLSVPQTAGLLVPHLYLRTLEFQMRYLLREDFTEALRSTEQQTLLKRVRAGCRRYERAERQRIQALLRQREGTARLFSKLNRPS